MGNGRACQKGDAKPKPMVKYDGVTPTEETLKNNYYCGCTKPEVDACAGFAPCQGTIAFCCKPHDQLCPTHRPFLFQKEIIKFVQ